MLVLLCVVWFGSGGRSEGPPKKIGKTLGTRHHYFSATDQDRAADLQEMLDDKNVQAVLCGRGGYGMSRIIDLLDFKTFKKQYSFIK